MFWIRGAGDAEHPVLSWSLKQLFLDLDGVLADFDAAASLLFHQPPRVNIITCRAREKFLHMRHPGDVLVDDYLKYKEAWEEAGGIFVHHTSARKTLARLAEIGLDVRTSE